MSASEKRNRNSLKVVSTLKSENATTLVSPETPPGQAECPFCFGTGMEVVSGDGARRCRCQSPDQRQRLFQSSRIPPRYQHCTLANFDTGETFIESTREYSASSESADSKWAAKVEAQRIIDDYLALDGRGLLYMGAVGVGKTHLAVAILRALIDRYHIQGLFYQFGALLKQIQDSYNPISQTSELRVLEPVFEADALVLDELGSSKPSDWVRDTMMQIINTRYNDKRLTIFTTNYLDDRQVERKLAELKALLRRYQNTRSVETAPQIEIIEKQIKKLLSGELLEDRIGSPLRSRLYEMCQKVVIEGEDYRKRHLSENKISI